MSLHSLGVYEIYAKNACAYADDNAVVFGQERITFAQLKEQVDALANGMEALGFAKGDRIAILGLNTHKYLWIFGAAAALGVIVVPINWRLAKEEAAYILEDTSPKYLVVDKAFADTGKQLEGQTSLLCFDPDVQDIKFLDSLMENKAPRQCQGFGDDPFCIIHTAAVDGHPRGAVLTHNNVIYSNIQGIATMQLGRRDAYLNMLPMFHITGLNLSMSVMHAGGRNIVMEKFDPAEALDLTQDEKVTVIGSFPPILSNLEAELDKNPRDVSSLSHVLGIDAPQVMASWQEKTNSTFWALYGQTETSGMVSTAKSVEAPGSAGRESLLATIKIVDENGDQAPAGVAGEILARGPLVFAGFWEKGTMSRQSFDNGWHRTGDLGKLDERGFLYFAGRKPEKELIKPGGENVYPAEVENVILQHPDVNEVCVIGVPDPKFGEGIKAICACRPGAALTPEEIMEFVAARIARYKKPRYVTFVEALPKTKDGEINRIEIKSQHG
ncbi:Acyl-CoA synthetase (AMP-forming)/AMP-acid ligase II [Desulfatibacillum alkenivorans DSM 16219]|jgi:long-chain acyl-CoA synthetase|uniref:Acyl-CoA synthetase (AMP-forming)/AMP-acid ligase II n=1 Tax=Desulfatibacillum alkenivorans DSM 16219 TaxID=1121393 RepID=A0A1M6FHX8_9BACT|nr:AMP-binding protein [Desulfatibacillum alkenivorans]SHI97341.1 Acyl-CoA synthetase (AMP-forming)/AMP-acid ligase II [Desulfatibacillum alkenivorans DSM 16219]